MKEVIHTPYCSNRQYLQNVHMWHGLIQSQHGLIITYSVKLGIKLFIYSQTSTVPPAKVSSGRLFSSKQNPSFKPNNEVSLHVMIGVLHVYHHITTWSSCLLRPTAHPCHWPSLHQPYRLAKTAGYWSLGTGYVKSIRGEHKNWFILYCEQHSWWYSDKSCS